MLMFRVDVNITDNMRIFIWLLMIIMIIFTIIILYVIIIYYDNILWKLFVENINISNFEKIYHCD